MDSEHIDLINAIIHGVLFLVKFAMMVVIIKMIKSEATPNKKRILIYSPNVFILALFTGLYIYCEAYFLYNFYKGIDLYIYEFIAMIDQIYLTVLVLLNLNKGDSYGKVIN